jgi:hypothetical protein
MEAFMLRLDSGEANYECFVQHILGKKEDIFIVNFRDSRLKEHLWNAIREEGTIN